MPPNTLDKDGVMVMDAVDCASAEIESPSCVDDVDGAPRVVCDKHEIPYVRCDSTKPFAMPPSTGASALTSSRKKQRSHLLSAEEVNDQLNLNLGLPLNPDSPKLRQLLRLIINLFSVFEDQFFAIIANLPLSLKQRLTTLGWVIYFPLHKLILGKRTGIHPEASYEYHALTTLLYWGRYFPVTVERMRFSLSQLCIWHPPEAYPECLSRTGTVRRPKAVVKKILYDMKNEGKLSEGIGNSDEGQSTMVTGYYIQQDADAPSEKVLFWLYGGAYLAGDSEGNIPLAEKIGQRCNVDVFLPDYRLIPENSFFDSLHDVIQSYEYLVSVRGVLPKNITCLGISSGGGLIVRLFQTIAERRRDMGIDDNFDANGKGHVDVPKSKGRLELEKLLTNPAGGVLMSPFVDYSVESCTQINSFTQYIKHDLIVNQSVIEEGLQYFESLGDADARRRESPVHRSFLGVAPLCMLVSEHEACYDQCVMLVNRARKDGVSVACGAWRYMCHVWPMLSQFIPEGRQAVDFLVDWINQHK